ncbi:Oidioi.mRNA.OKI2018_I69.XSR.g14509.t1.cds [Oikopleura dioica]|uniref:Oidioi.mRNA.OKI2018_I69.XSR.g14509.t1.cds n=1 Tax=Oikopleura dioica TaxID=34765 RepID=A0ABN7SEY8_OIKDI|nr:Oidioi.mRNA.OKI2018_I69.XSR.g14509.t1.cds [Oikopleura dioica]
MLPTSVHRIGKNSVLCKSDLLADAFKRFLDVEKHNWVSLTLSIMAEQCAANSDFKGYLNWLPKKSETLPHYWGKRNENALDLLGLKEQIDDDNERLENDWLLAKKVVEKLPERFGNKSIDVLKEEFKQYSLVVMSYSFEEVKEQEEDLFCEKEETEEHKFRMMMPVGDLLNHTADNNARIEIDDDTGDHTINATKKIKSGEEIFNTFGNMSNSRLLHMYGFAEEANDADDAYLSPESIESGIYEYESKIPAIKAKIKLLQNHGFMDEVRVSKDEELVESFRVLLAIIVMEKPAFNKMLRRIKAVCTFLPFFITWMERPDYEWSSIYYELLDQYLEHSYKSDNIEQVWQALADSGINFATYAVVFGIGYSSFKRIIAVNNRKFVSNILYNNGRKTLLFRSITVDGKRGEWVELPVKNCMFHCGEFNAISKRLLPPEKIALCEDINGTKHDSQYGYSHVSFRSTDNESEGNKSPWNSLDPTKKYKDGDLIYFVRNGALANEELFNECFASFEFSGQPSIICLPETQFQE